MSAKLHHARTINSNAARLNSQSKQICLRLLVGRPPTSQQIRELSRLNVQIGRAIHAIKRAAHQPTTPAEAAATLEIPNRRASAPWRNA